jgi:protein-tyrosine phosphatase
VYDFIEKNRSSTNVLVHCAGGISRSSTLLIFYTMKKYKKTYAEAYNIVKKKRRIIQPNTGFEAQLKQYEQ